MRSALLRLAWTILALALTVYVLAAYITTLRDLGVARAERDEARNLLVTLREQGAAQLGARMTRMETAFADLSASIDRRFILPLALPEPELISTRPRAREPELAEEK